MTIDPDAILPDLETVRDSIRGMKRSVHYMRFGLQNYPRNGSLRYKTDYDFSLRAAVAKKILKLERIIKEMQLIEATVRLNELRKAA